MSWTRRRFLSAAVAAARPGAARAASTPRLAALDWGLAATATGLGAPPIGVAERRLYGAWVGTPALPETTIELGLRVTPSLETIARLKPDLILINDLNASMKPRLASIAPLYVNAIFSADRRPLVRAIDTARDLGARIGRPASAAALIAEAEQRFAHAATRLQEHRAAMPILALAFADARHVRVYGRGSLVDDVLQRVGLGNAWTGATNIWGFAVVPVEALASVRDTILLIIAPVPPEARAELSSDGLWSALVSAGRNRTIDLPPVWVFGDLTAAMRCADLLADALGPQAGTRS